MNSRSDFQPSDPLPTPAVVVTDPMAYLAQTLTCDEEQVDLGHAAFAIASAHYLDFNPVEYLARLDALAEEAQTHIGRARKPEKILAALNAFLFQEQGFRGDVENYYAPANSFLNEVLDRRRGLPITLSVLYVTIAQRLGLPIVGVGLPLHFIVKYVARNQEIFLDPFYGGEILTPADCQARVERIVGRPVAFEPTYLQAAPPRLILYRLLNNLKQVYLRRNEPGRAGRVVEQMLVVKPDSPDDVRDRGLLFLQERALSRGMVWLHRYLELAPEASDAEQVRRAIERAYAHRTRLN